MYRKCLIKIWSSDISDYSSLRYLLFKLFEIFVVVLNCWTHIGQLGCHLPSGSILERFHLFSSSFESFGGFTPGGHDLYLQRFQSMDDVTFTKLNPLLSQRIRAWGENLFWWQEIFIIQPSVAEEFTSSGLVDTLGLISWYIIRMLSCKKTLLCWPILFPLSVCSLYHQLRMS